MWRERREQAPRELLFGERTEEKELEEKTEKGKSEQQEANPTDVLFREPRRENSVLRKAAESWRQARTKICLLGLSTWRSQVRGVSEPELRGLMREQA